MVTSMFDVTAMRSPMIRSMHLILSLLRNLKRENLVEKPEKDGMIIQIRKNKNRGNAYEICIDTTT